MGTFHALCARVLRRDGAAIGLDPHFVVYDTDDQQALMKQILREEDLPVTGEYKPSGILGAISRAKNEMLDADVPRRRTPTPTASARSPGSSAATRRGCARPTRSTSTTCSSRPCGSSTRRRRSLERYQGRWRYLHVDEYQDTNRPQYLWVKALAAAHQNLCVVGDDDQSIYSWRGADIRNILDFERDYPERDGRQARAELPLHPADPRRGPRRRRAQRLAQGQEALDRERRRPADRALRGLQRGGGGRVDRPPDRGADRRRAARS